MTTITDTATTIAAPAGTWANLPATAALRLYRSWQEAEEDFRAFEDDGADYDARSAAEGRAMDAQAAILEASVTGPADLAALVLAATDGETGPLVDPLKAQARAILDRAMTQGRDWLAEWNGLQASYRGATDPEVDALMEREEMLIHALGVDPQGERDLAAMVLVGFDTDFGNCRVVGPMVAYSMRLLARA